MIDYSGNKRELKKVMSFYEVDSEEVAEILKTKPQTIRCYRSTKNTRDIKDFDLLFLKAKLADRYVINSY